MRFIENGPLIPDELLDARDEGRVVFFCGSGVSRAKARMPDFFGLADDVVKELKADSNSDACKVLDAARKWSDDHDVTGLIPCDRVFALLERDFRLIDIQDTVAKCLCPSPDVDRSAHQLLLRLAKTPAGKTQLVTTNFDRLFEATNNRLAIYQAPILPQLHRYDDLDGIVYLHGRVNADYTKSDGAVFVLSSSDFGHAYLADGWAAEFFREIVRNFVVVFVGYSADDPPINYLLEGLSRIPDSKRQLYAFQSNEKEELLVRWHHKSVTPIAYSPDNQHSVLWETLEQWAIRADDPAKWTDSILEMADKGPRELSPHQRGMVAHLVSSEEGAKAFSRAEPPAEWLCVFDPACRYGKVDKTPLEFLDDPPLDPFSLYSLDDDPVPQSIEDESPYSGGDAPKQAWDAFATSLADEKHLSLRNLASVKGPDSAQIPPPLKRQEYLEFWVAQMAYEPVTLWWAARQEMIHPGFQSHIERQLRRNPEKYDPEISQGWQYLFKFWKNNPGHTRRDQNDLKEDLERDGWTGLGIQSYIDFCTPYVKVEPATSTPPVPVDDSNILKVSDLLKLSVECPVPPDNVDVPDSALKYVVQGLRINLRIGHELMQRGRRLSAI
ncbi:MAG: SIR2 family protein [Planctomycetaceae bacterium]